MPVDTVVLLFFAGAALLMIAAGLGSMYRVTRPHYDGTRGIEDSAALAVVGLFVLMAIMMALAQQLMVYQ
jgi:hypothetical protein